MKSGQTRSPGDFHSHLVPGVDDGARTPEEALDGVRRMWESGISRILTTPHLAASVLREPTSFRPLMESVDRAWNEIAEIVAREYPDVDFRRGHEIAVDVPDPDLSDPRTRLDGGRFVLLEWPLLQVPPGTPRVIERIVADGFTPVIAHPERYSGLGPELAVVSEWRWAGAFLQLSYGSLVGRYGRDVRATALKLLQRGLGDFLCTDFHGRPRHRLLVREGRDALIRLGGAEHLALLTEVNPGRLFEDQDPLPVPPLTLEEGIWDKIRQVFRGRGS